MSDAEAKNTAIANALSGKEFIVTKTVTVPTGTTSPNEEKALFIEHATDKAFGYMLVVKVPSDTTTDPVIQTLAEPSAINKTFTIGKLDNSNIGNTTLQITPVDATAETAAAAGGADNTIISVYTVTSAPVSGSIFDGITTKTISEMFVLEVNRQKTRIGEKVSEFFTAGIKYTEIQKQRLSALEDKIYALLMGIIPDTFKTNDKINQTMNDTTLKLKGYYNALTKTIDTDKIKSAAGTVKTQLDLFTTIPPQPDTTLIPNIKEYRSILSVGDTPFKLRHRAEQKNFFKKNVFSSDYMNKRSNYESIYNYLNALLSTWLQNPIRAQIINQYNQSNFGTMTTKMDYLKTIMDALPREEIVPVPGRFNLWNKKGGALTSVVYQKRRYNVHRDEHDRATIHLKKKAYVLKESSKGLYITLDGKREYVK